MLGKTITKLLKSFQHVSFFMTASIATLLGVVITSCHQVTVSATSGTDSASASTNVTLNLGSAISVRVLDSTGSYDITKLSFDFTPTSSGVTNTSRAVVEVGTSNTTGYKLYVESNYQDASGNYTTSLVNGDSDIPSNIGTINTSTTASGSYWNYVNPLLSTTSVIPAHGMPDKIAQGFTTVDSAKTNIDINVGVDTSIAAGTYNNQLLFTAIANANPINYQLNFLPNLPTGVDPSTLANFPENQQASSVATSYNFTIPATTPTLLGYTFVNYVDTATESEATPTTYHPGNTVEVLADTSSSTSTNDGEKTLKANWTLNSPTVTISYDDTALSNVTISADSATPLRSASTSATVNYGDTVTVSYNINPGYTINPITASYTDNITGEVLPLTITEDSSTATSGSFHFTMPDGNVTSNLTSTTNQYTLTVNPNGGTWSGSTSSQTFTQNYNTTKSIGTPSTNATYTVTYYANSQGASYTNTYVYPERAFSSWSLTKTGGGTATGSFNSSTNVYTYGAGNDTLTANYNASTSVSLQSITKTGHTCKWAEGSASGTQYTAGTSRTISSNQSYYAVCTPNTYTITVSNSNTTSGKSSFTVAYGGSNTVTVTPSSGYYLSSVTCPSGYTCSGYNTGTSYTGTQTVTITNNSTQSGGTLSFAGTTANPCKSGFLYLADGKCWTKSSQGTATWAKAAGKCPSGTHLPTKAEFDTLVGKYSGGGLYTATGWSGDYWSATSYSSSRAYSLTVRSSVAGVNDGLNKTYSYDVVCMAG